ncbi:MAG: helix-turn-helix transcriptional regulator [Clostridiales bacterium]|jgi:transcriptional regulator with XRE-family HTH domain|nr:helix-turn-helix transcriptional regulator [Clostridiales bacterium]
MDITSYTLDRIYQLRSERNWTEYKLAMESGIPQSTISTWYKKNLQPTIASLNKICHGCGITMAQFFSTSENFPDLTDDQKSLLSQWGNLSGNEREKVLTFMTWLIEKT